MFKKVGYIMISTIGIINAIIETIIFIVVLYFMPFNPEVSCKLVFWYLIINYLMGRYRNKALLIFDEIRMLLLSAIGFFFGCLLIFPVYYYNVKIFAFILCDIILMFVVSLFFTRNTHIWLRDKFKHNAMIIGIGKTAAELATTIRANRFSMIDVCCFIDCNDSPLLIDVDQKKVVSKEKIEKLENISSVLLEENIDTVMIAIPEMNHEDLNTLVDLVQDKVQIIKYLPMVQGTVTFNTKVDDFDGMLMISNSMGVIPWLSRFGKRLMDICGALCGMVILLPLIAYVRHRNRKEGDTDSIFFTQTRIGKGGKEFKIYKFRTMVPNAEKILDELMAKDPAIREEYQINKKLVNDPRITAAGKMLREKSLDEFPQFINVLKGEMSLVGPRPYLPREKVDMGDSYKAVIGCKPGLTGMWQTHGRSDVTFDERLELDEYYYKNWSFWLDVTLLTKTVRQVVYGKGAM